LRIAEAGLGPGEAIVAATKMVFAKIVVAGLEAVESVVGATVRVEESSLEAGKGVGEPS
jgi:hypothetical protein